MKTKIDQSSHNNLNVADMDDEQINIRKYFKQLRMRLIIGLLAGFMLPHIVLSAYFHFQFTSTLKKSGKLNLAALSESQRNTIDLFLQERVVNLFSLFRGNDFSTAPSKRDVANYLQSLRQVSDAFIDVGFLGPDGIQIGYAGPFSFLQGKNYSNEEWFKALLNHEKEYYISDIYLGFRKKPHFTIATMQMIDDKTYVMRSTLDPDKFYMFLRTISHGKDVESSLINKGGLYQIVDPDRGVLLGKCEYIPPDKDKTGVHEIIEKGDPVLIAHTWLKETDWALLIRQPLSIAHAQMYHARRVMVITLTIILLLLSALILFTTIKLIGRAQDTAEKKQLLRYQLIHASKLASVGELATGVAHEINNPLAIIISTSGVIKDMLNPEFNMDSSPENILKEVDIIESSVFRVKSITSQLLSLGRKDEGSFVPCNVNNILNDIIGGLKEREFKVADIELILKYDPDLPEISLDPDKIRQVFLNIINNAGDAILGPGSITIITKSDNENIYITIKDSGKGMSVDQMKQIFNPFYTTKEVGKGTGLGLSVSLGIVESMGGVINVQSLKEAGSAFTVSLPILKKRGVENG
ncbi:MAG: histidine kinase [Desulfobacterales bacterium]|jgi:two-component system, NtrC family, sensor kinase|nr:histidine kinase [Desulfobacterales bacterium]